AARRPSAPLPTAPGAAHGAEGVAEIEETVPTPAVSPDARTPRTPGTTGRRTDGPATDDTTVLRPVREERDRPADGPRDAYSDSEVTAELPQPPAPTGPGEETAVLPQVTPGAADETAVLPPVADGSADPRSARPAPGDATAVLPPVAPGAADETAVLPPVRGDDPADRVPPGYFRDERPAASPDGSEARTREMPQLDADGTPRRRPRPDWAEETPLDDLPSLADELLGSYDEGEYGERQYGDGGESEEQGGRGRGRGRGRRG
ncbi:dTMP kinase, partial [Streptomyces rubradiris]